MSQEPELTTKNDEEEPINKERRRFLLGSASVLAGLGAACSLLPFVSSWLPNAKTQAATGPIEVDLTRLEPGEQLVVAWQGKPVWIIRRNKAMLEQLANTNSALLRDPLSLAKQQPDYAKNQYRSINPEYLILIGLCTHLGCSPKYKPKLNELGPEWPGGFFCPCHGSTFDLAGRVFKGVPAPINLAVPPHHFLNEHVLIIGED